MSLVFRLTTVFCLLLVSGGSFIVLEEVFTLEDNRTPDVTVKYSISEDQTLACQLNENDLDEITLLSTNTEGSISLTQIELSLTNQITCKVGGDESNVISGSALVVPEFTDVCNADLDFYIQSEFTDTEVILKSNKGTSDPISCTCSDDTGDKVFTTGEVTPTETKVVLKLNTQSCTDNSCPCELNCGAKVTQSLNVIPQKLVIDPEFSTLTPHQNESVTVYFIPMDSQKAITCSVYSVTITDYKANIDATLLDGVEIEVQSPSVSVFVLYIKTLEMSTLGAVKCTDGTLETSHIFSIDISEESSLTTTKVDYNTHLAVPCSCNLIADFCDKDCCCDSDCSKDQVSAFSSCIAGPAGGDHDIVIKPDCTDLANVSPWERALCIKKSNSAYLGKYYQFVNTSIHSPFSWDSGAILELPIQATPVKGSSILTRSSDFTGRQLTLPGSFGESCIPSQPLRLMEDSTTTCKIVVSDKCRNELSPRFYLTPTSDITDPCQRYVNVYSVGLDSDDVTIKVTYQRPDKTLITHKVTEILSDEGCLYGVTDVHYTISLSTNKIVSIAAVITLQDLSTLVGSATLTTYKVEYKPAAIFSTLKPVDPAIGYNRYQELSVRSGVLTLPRYGNCDDVTSATTPQFGVSTITQCYKKVTFTSCLALYTTLTTTYSTFLQNNTQLSSTPGHQAAVPALITNPLNLTEVPELCDSLPTRLYLNIYHANNTLSGSDITNATLTYQYGDVVMTSRDGDDVTMLYIELRYLISDGPDSECHLCWEDLIEFFSYKQELLNSLIVVFVCVLYFAIPKNYMLSRL